MHIYRHAFIHCLHLQPLEVHRTTKVSNIVSTPFFSYVCSLHPSPADATIIICPPGSQSQLLLNNLGCHCFTWFVLLPPVFLTIIMSLPKSVFFYLIVSKIPLTILLSPMQRITLLFDVVKQNDFVSPLLVVHI